MVALFMRSIIQIEVPTIPQEYKNDYYLHTNENASTANFYICVTFISCLFTVIPALHNYNYL